MRFLPLHLLHLRQGALPWRQAVCAAFGVAAPVAVAVWLDRPVGLLFGAVGGLYASLLDFGGTLRHRLLTQFAGLALVVLSALAGLWLGPHHHLLFVTLAVLSFGIGWVDGTGVAVETILRFAALILLIYAFMPMLPPEGLPFFGLGMAAGLLAVWLDSLVWPRALPRRHPGLRNATRLIAAGHNAGWQHATGFCLAVCGGLALALWLGYQRPAWVAAATLFVIRPDGPDSLRRLFQSAFGTACGVALAWTVGHFTSDPAVLLGCVIGLAFLRPIALAKNLWAQSATLTALVLLLFDLALGDAGRATSVALLHARLVDTTLGSAVALAAMLLFNPTARRHLLERLRKPRAEPAAPA
ncbi:FUSC family protein [Chitinimonas koreensis]|uniref:FUSC family protein n=1 Tax=Chitinimonas koreensis TaxID=356302 RepID=UPI000425BC8A|nr:FUSC family protein [Chitinimonas koreensis]QNM95906.1 FUSC family protein [Chitinimonas koreensis]